MSVNLEPQELGFKRPFTHEVAQVLRLQNPNSDTVAFKVKTTAPKQYCVRPNSGRIDAGGHVEVQVLLQAMKEDPPLDHRCKDKFLVQSVAISAEQATGNVSQVWSQIEQTAKSSIQEKKIRVVFIPADGTAAAGATTNGVHHDDEPTSFSSPSPPAVTPQRPPRSEDRSVRPEDTTASTTAASDATVFGSTTAATALNSAATTVSNATGITQDDLKRQLDEAKAQIAKLQAQAAEATGLRQRKPEASSADTSSSEKTALATKQAPPGGVPVYIVALLCLLTFLTAFFLF